MRPLIRRPLVLLFGGSMSLLHDSVAGTERPRISVPANTTTVSQISFFSRSRVPGRKVAGRCDFHAFISPSVSLMWMSPR